MGQHLDKSARGAYDAIVYIDGSEVVAEDADGRVIKSGVAGIDDDEVRDAVISHLSSGGFLKISSGSFHWYTTPSWPANIIVEGNGDTTNIYLDADIHPFLISHSRIIVRKLNIYVNSSQTNSVLCMSASSEFISHSSFEKIKIYNTGISHDYDAVDLVSDGTNGIYPVTIRDIWAQKCNHLLHIRSLSVNSWANSNLFENLYADEFATLVEVSNQPAMLVDTPSGNNFSKIQGQIASYTINGFIIDGKSNIFINCFVWDWFGAVSPGYTWSFLPTSSSNTVIGAFASEWHARIPLCTCNDLGIRNNLIFPGKGSFSSSSIITVGAGVGLNYKTLSSAIDAISATVGIPINIKSPAYIIVDGPITETNSVTLKSNIEIIGINNATISANVPSGKVFNVVNVSNVTVRNLKVINSGSNYSYALYVGGSCSDLLFIGCTFESTGSTGGYNIGAALYGQHTNVKFVLCSFKGGPAETSVNNGVNEGTDTSTVFKYYDCVFESGGSRSSGSSSSYSAVGTKSELYNCVSYCGNKLNSIGFSMYYASSTLLFGCRSVPKEVSAYFSYVSENNGRFQPFSSSPYQLVHMYCRVAHARPGVTLSVGTTVGGSEIASGISMNSESIITFAFTKSQIPADGYMYVTPSGVISDGDVVFLYSVIYNYAGGYSCYVSSPNAASFERCLFKSNGASKSFYITAPSPSPLFTAIGCTFDTHGTNHAVDSSSTISGANIKSSTIIGTTHNIVGIDNKSSGSSTGTGIEQTIAHGLAAIPTGCKAWIRYPISATVYAEKEIRMDATNIYPKVKSGLAYDWRVE